MGQRLELQVLLESIQGNENVYFQPSRESQMSYPAIIYTVDDLLTKYADNRPYKQDVAYQITVITRDPDDATWRTVGWLPKCSFDRKAVIENLYHYYFTLYF